MAKTATVDTGVIRLVAAILVQRGWTQGTVARDSDGEPCSSLKPEASEWCLLGAIDRAIHDLVAAGARVPDDADTLVYRELERELETFCVWESPVSWQDLPDRTQEEVLKLLWPPK